jgi:hypothetical protein
VLWEQFGEPVYGMGGNARKHIAEPGERLDSGALAHGDEAQQHRRRLTAMVAAEKSPVAAAQFIAPATLLPGAAGISAIFGTAAPLFGQNGGGFQILIPGACSILFGVACPLP